MADRGLMGPRWWLILSIGFAVSAINLFPLVPFLVLALAVSPGPEAARWLLFLVATALILVVVPGAIGAIVATIIEQWLLGKGRSDRAPRWGWRTGATGLAFLFGLVAMPLWSWRELDSFRHSWAKPTAAMYAVPVDSAMTDSSEVRRESP